MDISRAVQFMMDDEKWITKLLIACVVTLLSVFVLPIFVLMGYSIQIARNVKDGMDVPLPEWDNWGGYFKDGLTIFAAGFIYMLPALILMAIGVAITGVGGATEIDAIAATGGVLLALFGCIAGLYSLALALIAPAIYVQYLEYGTLGACLRYREVIDIARNNVGDIIITILVILGISIGFSLVSWIPCLGWIIMIAAAPFTQFVTGHLYGQIAAKALGKGSKFDDIVIN